VRLGVVVREVVGVGLDLVDVTGAHPPALELENDQPVRREDNDIGAPPALTRQLVLEHNAPVARLRNGSESRGQP